MPHADVKQQLSQCFYGLCDPPQPQQASKRRKRALDGVLRSYRVRMWPTAEQTRELKRCFSASRHAYNWCVTEVNTNGTSLTALRNLYEHGDVQPDWAGAVSSVFVRSGISDCVAAFKAAHTNLRNGNIDHFDVHRRSHRKTKSEALNFDGDNGAVAKKYSTLLAFQPSERDRAVGCKRDECYVKFGSNLKTTGSIRLQDKPHVIQKMLAEGNRLQESGKILWDKRLKAFHLVYTYVLPRQDDPDPEFETKRLVATDPGVKSFQTFYTPTYGGHGEFLRGMRRTLENRCFAIDARVSDVTRRASALKAHDYGPTRTKRQRQHTFARAKRKLAKERERLREWMKHAHYETARLLLHNYDVIVAPQLPVAEMVPRPGRVFGSHTARAMLTWSHYRFTQRLHSASARYAGRYVLSHLGEPGTSKTCAFCGCWNTALGGSSTFECPRCGVKMDRDVAGARNNFFATLGMAVGLGYDGVSSQ